MRLFKENPEAFVVIFILIAINVVAAIQGVLCVQELRILRRDHSSQRGSLEGG